MSDDLPIVGRPRGSAWRQLQSEGILWEGQILVAGGDTDLAALLIVTNERLALVRGGVVALDILHDWLPAPPTLRRTGTIALQVLTPGQRLPESLTIIVREGRLAAAELVDVLTPQERYEPQFPTWDSNMFLDEDPIIPAYPARSDRKHSPAPVDPLPPFPVYASLDDDDFPPIAPPPDPMPDWSGDPRLVAGPPPAPDVNVIPRVNDWNLKPLDGMDNKERRNRRAWALRLAAVLLAALGIGAWQAGLLPEYDNLRARFEDRSPEYHTIAQRPEATPTQEPTTAPERTPPPDPTTPPAATDVPDQGPSSTQSEPTYAPAEQTAIALGVGGGEPPESDPEVNAAATEPASNQTPVIAPPAATEAPAEPESTNEPEQSAQPSATVAPILQPTQAPQQSAAATLAYQIADVQTGASLPSLTLGPLRGEQWVVVTMDVENPGSDPAVLDMADFVLTTADGAEFTLDSATGSVADFLGIDGNNGTRDTRSIGPGERTSIVLVFVPPADATGLTLQAGDLSLPLEPGATGTATGGNQIADQLSTQLLGTTFEQYSILDATATANAKTVPFALDPWAEE